MGEPVIPADGRRVAIWHNLREEAVLYINGTPYVLRETTGAYNNMREYSGIDGPRLEAMEESLKEEVLQEAHRLGGKVNVLYEEMTGVVCSPFAASATQTVPTVMRYTAVLAVSLLGWGVTDRSKRSCLLYTSPSPRD